MLPNPMLELIFGFIAKYGRFVSLKEGLLTK
jgi:hypothetical protein